MPFDFGRLAAVGGAYSVVAAAFVANIAIALVIVALALSGFAAAVWWQNRDNLRALDAMLKEKAAKGKAVLENPRGHVGA